MTNRTFLFILAIFTLLTGAGLIVSSPIDVTQNYVQFSSASGKPLKGVLTSPRSASKSGVILIHGVVVNKEYMATAAKMLADNHIHALAFDLGGYGESYRRAETQGAILADVQSAVSFLKTAVPNIQSIGLIGHSMGGTASVLAAEKDPRVRSAACIGMSADIKPFSPCRLLWATGLHDQLHSPREMREVLRASTARKGTIEGEDIKLNDCTHRLYFSSTANHQTEMMDFQILSDTTRWMHRTLKNKDIAPSMNAIKQTFGRTLAGIGTFLLILLWLCPFENKRRLSFLNLITDAIFCVLGFFQILPPFLCSSIIIFISLTAVISHYWTKQNNRIILRFFAFIFCLLFITDLVNILNALWEYVVHPHYLKGLPFYFIQTYINYAQIVFTFLRPLLFSSYTTILYPSWILIGFWALEIMKPGILLKLLAGLTESLLKRCQFKTLKVAWQKPSGIQMASLAVLTILLIVVLINRASSGFLTRDLFEQLTILFVRRFVPTVMLLIIALRQFRNKN